MILEIGDAALYSRVEDVVDELKSKSTVDYLSLAMLPFYLTVVFLIVLVTCNNALVSQTNRGFSSRAPG
jgi:hypothetical protein